MKPNNTNVHSTNAPAMASVERNVVVHAKSSRRTEDEPDAADIGYHRQLVRLVHLVPQPAHVNVDEVGLGHELVVPDLFQQHGARQHLVFAAHHVFQQAKFARQQINHSLATPGGALDEI